MKNENSPNIDKIKEQNIKLKEQLRELAKSMDELVEKEKERKLKQQQSRKPETDPVLKGSVK